MQPTSSPLRFLKSACFHNPALLHIYWTWKCAEFCFRNRKNRVAFGTGVRFRDLNVEEFVTLHDGCQLFNVEIGRMSYIGPSTHVSNTKIGRFCSIGPDIRIGLGGTHPTDKVSTHPSFYSPHFRSQITFADQSYFDEYPGSVSIGNDVWIGARATLVDGINIGDGAIIAAGSIVTRDVPPYAIVAGVPAKLVRQRFENETIQTLLKIAWWERDLSWLVENFRIFNDVNSFCSKYGTNEDGKI